MFMLKSFLTILVLSISFQVSFAQKKSAATPSSLDARALKLKAEEANNASKPANVLNTGTVVLPGIPVKGSVLGPVKSASQAKLLQPVSIPSTQVNKDLLVGKEALVANDNAATDVPSLNNNAANTVKAANHSIINPIPNNPADVCTFTGSLVAGDPTLTNGRMGRNAIASTCAAPKTCPGPLGTGPFFYDTYTLKNTTGASQCVTISYVSDGTSGDVLGVAYLGCFVKTNVCTNYLADGGSSSNAGGTPLTFSCTVPSNGILTVILTQINAPCQHYTLIVSGLPCTPLVAPTQSILSQVGGVPVATNLIDESFNAAAFPAGWAQQNLSNPTGTPGIFSDWFQGSTAGAFIANSAPDFRGASFFSGSGLSTLSNWMFAPTINLRNGDQFSFYTRTISGAFPDRMQVRLSTNGNSTNVGASETSVGDFTRVLFDINPNYTPSGYPTAWTQYTVTMSGLPAAGVSGRIAFRYFVELGGPGGNRSNLIGVDDVLYQTFTSGPVTTCAGSVANLKVDITGGTAPFTVVIHPTVGADFTVNNYNSGDNIPVTPVVTTTYSLVSVAPSGSCIFGTGNAGTPTVTVSAGVMPGVIVTASPDGPLCAGNGTVLRASLGAATPPGVLYTQTGAAGLNGPPSQVFEPANTAFNSQAADDFTVPGGTTWTITSVSATGGPTTQGGTPTSINVFFYANSGSNLPGAPVASLLNITTFTGGNTGIYNVTLPSAVNLTPGTYWVSVQINMPFVGNGQWFWSTYGTTNVGSEHAWQNPGGGFGTPCTNWGYGATGCGVGGGVNRNLIFSLTGTTIAAGPPLPPGWTVYWTPGLGLSSQTTNPTAASPMLTTTYTALVTATGGCQTSASKTVIINQLPAVSVNPVNTTVCANSTATFTAAGIGTGITYQWQVSVDNGTSWNDIPAGAPYSGVTTGTLTINPTPLSFNNNRYRLKVSGVCSPVANSTGAILTVNGLPGVTITPAGPVCGGVAGINGTLLSAGAVPPPIPGSVTVSKTGLAINVPDNTPNGVSDVINVATVPAGATVTGVRVKFSMTHTFCSDMLFNLKAPNGTILALDKYLNGTAATGGAYPNLGFVNTVISSAGSVSLGTVVTTPITGTYKADLLNGVIPNPPGLLLNFYDPAGFVSTATSWNQLFSTPNGNWTLAMADGGPADFGILTAWSITIDYTTPGPAGSTTYTWSPLAGLYTDPTAIIPYTGGQTPIVYAAPADITTYTVTATDVTTGCSNTSTVIVNYTPPAPTVNPAALSMCLGDVASPLTITSALQPATQNFSSGAISVAIPDGPSIFPTPPPANYVYPASTSTIPVVLPAGAAISKMAVRLNITHTFVGDLVIALKAPNGNVFNLDAALSKTDNPGANFVNTVISSTGVTALNTGTAPFTATFKPDAVGATFDLNFGPPVGIITYPGGPVGFVPNVTTFSGLYSVPSGNWTIAIFDVGQGDVGTLTNWSMDITYGVPASGVWSPVTGLFNDAAASSAYVAGTLANTVYARPQTPGANIYNVSVFSPGFPILPTPSANTNPITINDVAPATPYPSTINVSGLPTTGVSVKSVTINGLQHTFPADIDMILQSPSGVNVVLMSDAGGGSGVNNVTYTFDDAAAALSTGANPSGTYHPTNFGATDTWVSPGPGTITQATPALSLFGSTADVNGGWKLFIVDDLGGDVGVVARGYSIQFSYLGQGCQSPARTVVVTVNVPIALNPSLPADAVVCTDKVTTFTVATTAGTSPTYQWQVSADNGNTWSNITNNAIYSGATTATLTLTAPPASLNGNLYRAVVSGAAPCGSVNSRVARLTVNPLPTITIAASPYKNLFPGLRTTISSTVSPLAATYTWLRNGTALTATSIGIVSGLNTGALQVDIDGLGDYRLRVTDVNGCTNTSNTVTIADSLSGRVFIYPNPNSGQFQVRYNPTANNVTPRGINVFNSTGQRIANLSYTLGLPYARMNVDLRTFGAGVYWIEVVDLNGERLAIGRVEVLR